MKTSFLRLSIIVVVISSLSGFSVAQAQPDSGSLESSIPDASSVSVTQSGDLSVPEYVQKSDSAFIALMQQYTADSALLKTVKFRETEFLLNVLEDQQQVHKNPNSITGAPDELKRSFKFAESEALMKLHKTRHDKNALIDALGELQDPRAIMPLLRLLQKSDDISTVSHVINALISIGRPSLDSMIRVLSSDYENPEMKAGAALALVDMPFVNRDIIPLLLRTLPAQKAFTFYPFTKPALDSFLIKYQGFLVSSVTQYVCGADTTYTLDAVNSLPSSPRYYPVINYRYCPVWNYSVYIAHYAIAAILKRGIGGKFLTVYQIDNLRATWDSLYLSQSRDPEIMIGRLYTLENFNTSRTAKELLSLANSKAWIERWKAARLLSVSKDPLAPASLLFLLKDKRAEVREQAAWSYAFSRDVRAGQPLLELLADSSGRVRLAAARGLGELGIIAAIGPLHSLAGKDADFYIRMSAKASLRRLNSIKPITLLSTSTRILKTYSAYDSDTTSRAELLFGVLHLINDKELDELAVKSRPNEKAAYKFNIAAGFLLGLGISSMIVPLIYNPLSEEEDKISKSGVLAFEAAGGSLIAAGSVTLYISFNLYNRSSKLYHKAVHRYNGILESAGK
jgi:HEAT repeat protein